MAYMYKRHTGKANDNLPFQCNDTQAQCKAYNYPTTKELVIVEFYLFVIRVLLQNSGQYQYDGDLS